MGENKNDSTCMAIDCNNKRIRPLQCYTPSGCHCSRPGKDRIRFVGVQVFLKFLLLDIAYESADKLETMPYCADLYMQHQR